MDEIIKGLTEKVGISPEQANGVIEWLKENSDTVMAQLSSSGLKDKLPGGLGNLLG